MGVKLTVDGKLIDAIADMVKDAFTFDTHNVFAASVLVTQPIYMGGKIRALNKITNYAENIARMALSQRCGTPLDKPMTLADEDRDNFNVSLRPASFDMRDVYENRYDFKALQLGAKMFEEKAKVARSEMLPTIAAIGCVYTTNPNVFNGFKHRFDFSYSIGAVVKIPIWHWGGLSNKYKAAVVDAKIKDLEIEDAKEKIELQVTQANLKYQEACRNYETSKTNLTKADENLRVAQLGFREGMSTSDEVLTAQTAWLLAHSEKIDSEIDVMMCDVYLSKVTENLKY